VNTNNGVKWRRFIVPKKVEQINDHALKRNNRLSNRMTYLLIITLAPSPIPHTLFDIIPLGVE